ncbi:MAG: right-handed parallel beta-helix repeat-containing protein [Flavisolibacter sp.]
MKKLFLLPFIIFGLAANATNYYISSGGNDANNGTSTSTPWKTIAKIKSSTFSPGDFIFFRRGDTWREQLTIPSSGSAGSPITFAAYGTGAKPVINGADIITGWTNSATNIWWVNNPNAVTTRAMVVIDDAIYAEEASLVGLTSANKYFIDAAATPDRLYVYSTTDPDNLTAEVSKREYCIQTSGNSKRFIEINDIEVRYAGRAGIYFEGPGASTTNAFNGSSVVRRCFAYANRQFGMAHVDHYDNVLFEDCEATYNGNGFYSWVADEGTFRRCSTANQIHSEAISLFSDGGAIQCYQGDNWLVENCYSINDYDAIHIDCGGVAANAIIRYNKVFNSRSGSPNTPGMGVGSLGAGATIQIYYNLIVNGASAAFECYSRMKGKVEFYNNTIYLKPGTGTNGTIYLKYGDNFIFKNNLITREGSARGFHTVLYPNMTISDYNLYWNFPPVSPVQFYYQKYYSLATWRKARGQDMNSQMSDPLFVNRLSDWSLQSGSPAINKGVNVGLTKDILGNPIVGLPDIGAYEHANAIAFNLEN